MKLLVAVARSIAQNATTLLSLQRIKCPRRTLTNGGRQRSILRQSLDSWYTLVIHGSHSLGVLVFVNIRVRL